VKITPVAIGKVVHSCWCQGNDLHVIFTDHTEIIVTWGWKNAELRKARVLSALPAVGITDGPITSILLGRTVDYCYLNDVDDLVIKATDGHECVIGFDKEPVIKRMDVKILVDPLPGIFSDAG
jgi:hypothetical protein